MECSFNSPFGYSSPEASEWHGMVIDTVTVIPANASSHDSLYTADTNYLPEVRSQGVGTTWVAMGTDKVMIIARCYVALNLLDFGGSGSMWPTCGDR